MSLLLAVLLFLTAVVLPRTATAAGLPAACYNIQGVFMEGWLPCNTTTKGPSPCCGSVDFCLDNGLCLNGGANNFYSQQGCTDPRWGAPCTWLCPTFTGNYSELWLCGQATEDSRYCCGTDASCCDAADSTLLSIDVFTAVSRAGNVVAAAATASATATETTFIATTTVSATATSTSTATTTNTTTTTTPSPSPSPASASANYYKHTTIGVSTALSLVAVLASAVMFFLGRRWERTHAHAARQRKGSSSGGFHGGGGGSDSSPPLSSTHHVQPYVQQQQQQQQPPQYYTALPNGPTTTATTTTGELQQPGLQQGYDSTAYHEPVRPSELVGSALSHELTP